MTPTSAMAASAMPAMIQPEEVPVVSDAGLVDGDGSADVGAALVDGAGASEVGAADVGDALVGDGEGLASAYEKVMPPSMGWPSCETTR